LAKLAVFRASLTCHPQGQARLTVHKMDSAKFFIGSERVCEIVTACCCLCDQRNRGTVPKHSLVGDVGFVSQVV